MGADWEDTPVSVDATPSITSLSPSTWTAGGVQNFTISGSGFGTSPSIGVTGDIGGGSYGAYSGSTDTSISAWVDLTFSSGGTASVTVTSNGYGGMGFLAGPVNDSPNSGPATATITVPPPPCPTSVVVSSLTPLTVPYDSLKTGIGTLATTGVGPGPYNYKGVQIQESVSPATNTCPPSFGACSNGDTFTVGDPGGGSFGQNTPAQTNLFYDWHVTWSTTSSYLDDAGIQSCSRACSQVFTCNGNQVGSFTVTRSFSKAVINGQNVTAVAVDVQ